MRMKKFLILSAAVLGAVACSNTYEVKETTPPAIGFGTWANTMTKGRDITDAVFSSGDKFNVFGSKVLSETPTVVFNGDEVSTTDGTTWTYAPPRYWDAGATGYTFYAISPAGLVTGLNDTAKETAAKTGAFTTDEITFDGTVANDVLISKKTPVIPNNYNKKVNLDFQHVASLLDVKVKKSFALKDATVKVTAISLENIIYKGTFNVASYVTTEGDNLNKPVVAIDNWTPATSGNTNTFTGTVTSGGTELTQYGYASVTDEALVGTDNYFWQNFVVMPQTLVAPDGTNPQQIKISYTIETSIGEVTTFANKTVAFSAFDLVDNKTNNTADPAAGDGAAATGWSPNIHYIYTLTLDANKIDFTASITPWATTSVNGFYNLVN